MGFQSGYVSSTVEDEGYREEGASLLTAESLGVKVHLHRPRGWIYNHHGNMSPYVSDHFLEGLTEEGGLTLTVAPLLE